MQRDSKTLGAMVIAIAIACIAVAAIGWTNAASAQGKRKVSAKKAAADGNFKSAADQWEKLAFDAIHTDDVQDIASYLWALNANCESVSNDLARRQCLGLREMRKDQVASKKFLVRGDRRSLLAGTYDPKTKTSQFKVYSCFSCTGPIEVSGQPLYVLGQGQKTVFGTQILGPVLYQFDMPFPNAEEAAQWKSEVASRLRSEYVVRIPMEDSLWTSGSLQGLAVEVLGFRVYDPCTGKMHLAEPKAKSLPKDDKACTGEDLLALQRAKEAETAPDERSKLPLKLTPKDVQTALEPASRAAQECHTIYGVDGEAKFRITIADTGKVTAIEQTGYFVDTPTGECIETAIRATVFPQTQKESTTVSYPFMLR